MAPDHQLRRLRLEAIVDHYWPSTARTTRPSSSPHSAAGFPVGRYAPVTKDATTTTTSRCTRTDQRAGAREFLGDAPWHPHALYDLHTGEQLGIRVKVEAIVTADRARSSATSSRT